jgi:hypothetical protein
MDGHYYYTFILSGAKLACFGNVADARGKANPAAGYPASKSSAMARPASRTSSAKL